MVCLWHLRIPNKNTFSNVTWQYHPCMSGSVCNTTRGFLGQFFKFMHGNMIHVFGIQASCLDCLGWCGTIYFRGLLSYCFFIVWGLGEAFLRFGVAFGRALLPGFSSGFRGLCRPGGSLAMVCHFLPYLLLSPSGTSGDPLGPLVVARRRGCPLFQFCWGT